MGKEVDWAREFDELDGAVEVDKIEIDWLEEFDKVTEEVESLSGYPGVVEVESEPDSPPLDFQKLQSVIEGAIAESVEEDKLSEGKGNWLKELLNKKVVLPVATAVGILGLIWGGSLLIEREGETVLETAEPTTEPATPIVATPETIDTEVIPEPAGKEVKAEDTGVETLDWGEDLFATFLEFYELDRGAVLAGVGENDYDWGESGTPESAGGTGTEIEAEPAPAPLANKVELAFNQTEYVLRPGDTMLSVAEEMKNDKLVSNQVEGLARLFKNNSWFSEGANFDRYKDYVSEIKTMIDVNPGVNPADITMGDGRTLAEWLIQVMHDVPVGLEIKI
jgi:hypothetical protein